MGLARQWRFLRGLCADHGVAAAAMCVPPPLFTLPAWQACHTCVLPIPWRVLAAAQPADTPCRAAGAQALHRRRASSPALAC